ncbi:polysaccharide deacetylase family protein [Paracoccus laeviglucosivorans]|uniref:Chitooligosaccharide deacetylase n=1 Tax=Paracoccus laeviglucosivorans TaxID=1197861 RepID=A0A521FNE5_9RHOB|nr:polysaccharide deacetylase family protein [Paracoccus laeviglucosivorans]SMO97735.1 Peptidoglycan/xylan/chitin deacetylase, PgdA/CDA1 family [Paracoccus laeviglucosivorans]
MPWKDNYTTSDETGIRDGDVRWPDGQQMALGLTVNLNPAASGKGITAKDLAYPTWHFGMHEGMDAFLALFARLGIRATFAVPALVADAFAPRMRQIIDAGHEIAAQGLIGEDPTLYPDEAARIAAATETLTRVTGTAPQGWFALSRPDDAFATGTISDDTIRLLRDAGYAYYGNGLADDAPYWWVTDVARAESLLALPYYYHFDDTFFLMFPREGTGLERPDALLRNWRAQFRAQYRRGRYFNLCVSPARSGWAHRLDNLAMFLTKAMTHPGVWAATGSQIAAHWQGAYPASSQLQLEPSIWRDYADSLS